MSTAAVEGLRHWEKGIYSLEAGIDVLARAVSGRFTGITHIPRGQQGADRAQAA